MKATDFTHSELRTIVSAAAGHEICALHSTHLLGSFYGSVVVILDGRPCSSTSPCGVAVAVREAAAQVLEHRAAALPPRFTSADFTDGEIRYMTEEALAARGVRSPPSASNIALVRRFIDDGMPASVATTEARIVREKATAILASRDGLPASLELKNGDTFTFAVPTYYVETTPAPTTAEILRDLFKSEAARVVVRRDAPPPVVQQAPPAPPAPPAPRPNPIAGPFDELLRFVLGHPHLEKWVGATWRVELRLLAKRYKPESKSEQRRYAGLAASLLSILWRVPATSTARWLDREEQRTFNDLMAQVFRGVDVHGGWA